MIIFHPFGIIGVIISVLIYFVYKHIRLRKILKPVPSVRSLPFIGHVHITKPDVEGFVDQIMGVANLFPDAPRMVTFWAGTIPSVMVYSADLVGAIAANSSHLNKGIFYDLLKPWLGCGLLTSGAVEWRPRRKLLTPTFHYDILRNFLHVFNYQSEILIKKLQEKVVNGIATIPDIGFMISLCALDIICETSMGQSVDAQEKSDSDYVTAVLRINDIIQRRQKNPLMWNNFLFRLFGDGKKHDWALNVLHSFTKKVISERRKLFGSSDNCESKLAFLDLLLEMERNGSLNETDIQEEVDTFMFEGHDTTATGITWTIQMLGCHEDLQEKAYEEIMEICGDSSELTLDHIGQMKYLECFIRETLRLYPSVPIIARRSGEDSIIGGHFIPQNTQLLINIYLIHRDPSQWKDPEVFDPDRFLPENCKSRHPFAYMPFSAGSRNCIGQRFALLEEKSVIAWILRHFRIKSLMRRDKLRHKTELILRPIGGVSVQLFPRATASDH